MDPPRGAIYTNCEKRQGQPQPVGQTLWLENHSCLYVVRVASVPARQAEDALAFDRLLEDATPAHREITQI